MDPDSGAFLGQAGHGLSTLAGQTNYLYVGIPAGRTGFTLSIFDGDGDNHWDQPDPPVDVLDYRLYKDPYKTGGTTHDLRALLIGIPIEFTATASDPGSDDITFGWTGGTGLPPPP